MMLSLLSSLNVGETLYFLGTLSAVCGANCIFPITLNGVRATPNLSLAIESPPRLSSNVVRGGDNCDIQGVPSLFLQLSIPLACNRVVVHKK